MAYDKLRLLAMSAFLASGLMACDATGPCQEAGYSGAQLTACKIGVEQVGPHESSIAGVDRVCTERYNVRDADPNDPHAFDSQAAIAGLFTACHKGALCYLHLVNGVEIPNTADEHVCDSFASLGALAPPPPPSYTDGGVPAGGVPFGQGGAEGAPGCEQVTGPGGTTRCL